MLEEAAHSVSTRSFLASFFQPFFHDSVCNECAEQAGRGQEFFRGEPAQPDEIPNNSVLTCSQMNLTAENLTTHTFLLSKKKSQLDPNKAMQMLHKSQKRSITRRSSAATQTIHKFMRAESNLTVESLDMKVVDHNCC